MTSQEVVILYRNWQGDIAYRTVLPKSIYYGSSQWHPEEQWLLIADDLEKKAERHFSMKDILSWSPKKIKTGV